MKAKLLMILASLLILRAPKSGDPVPLGRLPASADKE